jgi:hypothetical protein
MLPISVPDLSQRTLAHVMKVLEGLVPEDADTAFLRREFWQIKLFEWGFPPWLIDYAEETNYDWIRVIRDLYGGRVTQKLRGMTGTTVDYLPRILQESMLIKLTAMAMTEEPDDPGESAGDRERLRLSLLLDGFEMSQGKMVSVEGPVNIAKEKSRLLADVEASAFARKQLIAKHLNDAEDLFSEGKMHPAMAEARSALQAGIEDTLSLVEHKVGRKSGGGLRNQIEFLARENFLSADEQQAFLAAWGFLSAGAHPGLPPDEVGRIGLIFGLEFTQVLLVKAKALS